ncbi:hypothetical protein PVAP13_2NG399700 [Panicum virgatum]|nr:hypothetical protein PVAP13_2NG399700 [Panicum virgatum]
MQHQLSFHQRKVKRRRVSKSSELGPDIDGKYETQQKTSGQVPGNFSNGVTDVRYQGQSPAELSDGTVSGQLGVQPSLKPVPFRFQELTMLPQQEKEPYAGEPVNHQGPHKEMTGFSEQEKGTAAGEPIPGHRRDPKETIDFPEQEKVPAAGETISEHHKDPLKETTSAAELEKGPSAGEPASGHHRDAVDNSDNHRTHVGTCDNSVASLSVHAESKLSTCNFTNVHENDSSKDLELSNTDYPQKFNKSDETFGVPKEVSPTVDDPVESKSTNDLMGPTDITPAEQVSQSYDLQHGKFGSSKGNDFLKQLDSATRNEADLNSIDMEVDDGNITINVDNLTSFKSEKPLDNMIMDCEMTSLKDDEIKSGVRIRDVNLNSCSDAISSPISGGNYETSNAPDDAIRSSIIAQCFGTNSNEENAGKGENFVNQKNDMVYQSNLTMGSIPAAQINVDCFTSSCSMTPEIKNYGNRGEDDAKEALVNSQNMTNNETGFDVEAYNSDIFNSTITESSLAQLNNAINMKNDFASCYTLSDLNTLTGGNATDEIDIHGMRSSFVSSTSRTDQNEHCKLDFDIKGSMLEALEKSDSDLENQYNGAGPSCDSLPAAGTSGNIDEFMSMQTNFGSFTSLVRAVEDVPLSRILQDQCDLQLGFGGPKQQMYPSFEQQLRMATAGAPPYGNMGRHDAVPVPEPTLMLGYAPPLGSCLPPFQLGWGPSYSKMVGVLQSVCVWCNSQFQHFGTVAEQQADSLGYICPACKGKFSGHLGINGPSI